MLLHALLVTLLALPFAAFAQAGGPTPPAPIDSSVTPAPPPPPVAAAPVEAPLPTPVAPAPQEAPPPPVAQTPPPVVPPPQAMAPPPAPAPAPAPAAAAAPAPAPAAAQAEPPKQPRESKWRASASIGAGSSYGNTYYLVGVRLGRELAARLSLELEGQYWGGQSPSLGKIAPGLTWYAPFRLYLGAYYAHWFVGSGVADQDAVGVRAGYTLISRGRTFAGVGVAYERAMSCSSNCDSWWPEASVGVSF